MTTSLDLLNSLLSKEWEIDPELTHDCFPDAVHKLLQGTTAYSPEKGTLLCPSIIVSDGEKKLIVKGNKIVRAVSYSNTEDQAKIYEQQISELQRFLGSGIVPNTTYFRIPNVNGVSKNQEKRNNGQIISVSDFQEEVVGDISFPTFNHGYGNGYNLAGIAHIKKFGDNHQGITRDLEKIIGLQETYIKDIENAEKFYGKSLDVYGKGNISIVKKLDTFQLMYLDSFEPIDSRITLENVKITTLLLQVYVELFEIINDYDDLLKPNFLKNLEDCIQSKIDYISSSNQTTKSLLPNIEHDIKNHIHRLNKVYPHEN